MAQPDPEHGNLEPVVSAPPPTGRRGYHPAVLWLVAMAVLIALAGVAGLATAYLVAELRAAPSPDAAFLPTPTPTASPSPRPTRPPAGPSEPTQEPTLAPEPEPTAEVSPDPSPGATPLEYVVQRGDSIGRIAARFGVSPESIIELNELRNPNRILPGQVLLIPLTSAAPEP